jgi:hypothetical protein
MPDVVTMSDIYETTAQLAALWPALAAALPRDTTTTDGPPGSAWTAATLVNPDVLAAIITLNTQIPATHENACQILGERWHDRLPDICLRALPACATRMDSAGHHREASVLTRQAAGWLRLTQRALGLRKHDRVLTNTAGVPYACPHTDTFPENHPDTSLLIVVGAERVLRHDPDGLHAPEVSAQRIYCASPDCDGVWTAAYEWHLLGLMLGVPSLAATA